MYCSILARRLSRLWGRGAAGEKHHMHTGSQVFTPLVTHVVLSPVASAARIRACMPSQYSERAEAKRPALSSAMACGKGGEVGEWRRHRSCGHPAAPFTFVIVSAPSHIHWCIRVMVLSSSVARAGGHATLPHAGREHKQRGSGHGRREAARPAFPHPRALLKATTTTGQRSGARRGLREKWGEPSMDERRGNMTGGRAREQPGRLRAAGGTQQW